MHIRLLLDSCIIRPFIHSFIHSFIRSFVIFAFLLQVNLHPLSFPLLCSPAWRLKLSQHGACQRNLLGENTASCPKGNQEWTQIHYCWTRFCISLQIYLSSQFVHQRLSRQMMSLVTKSYLFELLMLRWTIHFFYPSCRSLYIILVMTAIPSFSRFPFCFFTPVQSQLSQLCSFPCLRHWR